jgi:predicted dehydrogenase
MSSKLSVRAVCDAVLTRAASVADEFKATAVVCPWSLTQRKDLHAWLILDPGWFETYPASLAVRHARWALLANTFSLPIPKLSVVLQRSSEQGDSLMPEFPERFSPATTRLRELMATKLGPVRRIDATIPLGEASTVECWLRLNQAGAIGLIDWCTWLIGESVSEVNYQNSPVGPHLEFCYHHRDSNTDRLARVVIRFVATGTQSRRVECERGRAVIAGPTQITWEAGHARSEETLSHERSPYEIFVDQFCRRALGGLLPVPTAKNALQAVAIFQQATDLVNRDGRTN